MISGTPATTMRHERGERDRVPGGHSTLPGPKRRGRSTRAQPLVEGVNGHDSDNGDGSDGNGHLLDRIRQLADTRRGRVGELRMIDQTLAALLVELAPDQKMEILFGEWAKRYDEDMGPHASAVAKLIRKMRPSIRGSVLDLSTGTGLIPKNLLNIAAVNSIIANDSSPDMLGIAMSQLANSTKQIQFRREDAETIKTPAGIDVVFLAQTVHLVPDAKKRGIVKNASRLLKRGGNFFLIDEWPPMVPPAEDLVSVLLNAVFQPIGLEALKRTVTEDAPDLVERETHIVDIVEKSGVVNHRMYGIRFEKM